ncbi:Uncharacterised protein [Bordetella pertussis]|nr:Uncharacterised protein [Bordetella pertussis]CFP66244.1 Uncharacterised protein [Bordetella pertussis]CFW42997.1 Uncharacterised protein [Bordetella pertussis]
MTTRSIASATSWVCLTPCNVSLLTRSDSTPRAAPTTSMKEKNASTPNRLPRIDRFARNLRMTGTTP